MWYKNKKWEHNIMELYQDLVRQKKSSGHILILLKL
jgi:hypothetical protein